MKKGKLFIFEGIDGSSKTTQAKILVKKLKALYFQEPANKKIKKIILEKVQPLTELFLFLAERSEVYFKIKKFLNQGKNIILDRSFPSTLAYQLKAKGLEKIIPLKEYLKLDFLVRKEIEPDLVIIFDLPVKVALSRLRSPKTKFEEEKFLEKVRKAYLELAKKFNWLIVDARRSEKEVTADVLSILKAKGLLKDKEKENRKKHPQ